MKDVGKMVDNFFREELTVETLTKEQGLKEVPDDPTDIMDAPDWVIHESWHPTKDGKCHHVGLCELQIIHWRQQAGLLQTTATTDEPMEKETIAEQEEQEVGVARNTRRRKRRRNKNKGKGEATLEEHSKVQEEHDMNDDDGEVSEEDLFVTADEGSDDDVFVDADEKAPFSSSWERMFRGLV
ncbi:MAG: hypothetical protein LQ350_008733 [Teloschistes chrysophthalmus]|nr:MAG: hypothetical protein LQ350_008733 [Niorma chrysophthalma]